MPLARHLPTLNLTWRFALTAALLGVVLAVVLNLVLGQVVARQALVAAEEDTSDLVARQLLVRLRPEDFSGTMDADRLQAFDLYVKQSVISGRARRVKVWNRQGAVVYSDDHAVIGRQFTPAPAMLQALDGKVEASLVDPRGASRARAAQSDHADEATMGRLIEVYAPLSFPGDAAPAGAVEVYEGYGSVESALSDLTRRLLVGLGAGMALIYVALLGIVHGGTRTIREQDRDLRAHASDLEQANVALQDREERFRALVLNASDVLIVLDAHYRVTYAGPSITGQWGRKLEDVQGIEFTSLVHMADRETLRNALLTCRPGDHRTLHFRVAGQGSDWLQIEATATNLFAHRPVAGLVLNCHDITQRARFEQQLVDQAFHDPLTGLPNRALFLDRVEHALAAVDETGDMTAVMFLDLDRFKVVNDSLGHAAGDQLLIAAARRLAFAARPQDTIARMGGDEFAIVVPGVHATDEAMGIAERLLESFHEAAEDEFAAHPVSASFGVAISTGAGTARDLLRNADVAMYEAKAQGGNCIVLFDPLRDQFSLDRLGLEADLHQAVERGELRVYYQPSVDLQTGRVVALEALARWQHPERGQLQPDMFIPLAMETGDIVTIGRWILHEACRQAYLWQSLTPVIMRVNLSAIEFEQADLLEHIESVLRGTGLQPDRLEIEITESMLMRDTAGAIERLVALKRRGIRLAIDDFGTGYSSLSYLASLPVDALKIDRSFVNALDEDERTGPIIRAIMLVGGAMHLNVIAEGIETARQLAYLQRVHCAEGQGFLFAQPLETERTERLLEAGRPFDLHVSAA